MRFGFGFFREMGLGLGFGFEFFGQVGLGLRFGFEFFDEVGLGLNIFLRIGFLMKLFREFSEPCIKLTKI